MVSGNKGEWSEFYAFLKLLTEKKLFAGDENLEQIAEKYFIILKIIREEAVTGKKTYIVSEDQKEISIFDNEEKKVAVVVTDFIRERIGEIFEEMKSSTSGTFSIRLGDEAMEALQSTQIKAGSNRKTDITLMVHDSFNPAPQELGFSIKSMIGSPSTLLNASQATNFIFKITESIANENLLGVINDMGGSAKVRDRMQAIEYGMGNINYLKMDRASFEKNLRMIDSLFPQMMAEVVKAYYSGHGSLLTELVDFLDKSGILEEKFKLSKEDFTYKIKIFLCAIALGMTPVKSWDGLTKAHGGYIVVREDGEIVCYHLYNRDEFQDYLYKNVRLETPSTTRHGYGKIYEENGEKLIKLNLQIRFIK